MYGIFPIKRKYSKIFYIFTLLKASNSILHIDETLENIFEISAVKVIEKSIIVIIQEELEAENEESHS